jgi:phosphoribosylanthranilate isomerase
MHRITRFKICCIADEAEAIGVVHPYGVDVCSGVRTEGRLDESKLRAFVAAVRAAG